MANETHSNSSFELCYNPFSICSLMTLLTVRWKGKPASSELAVDPIETEVDIYLGEQNQEDFLKKNWKGQVPVLLGPGNVKITDSLEITHFLAERYPQLIPQAHKDIITPLLDELHQLWFVSLSFTATEGRGAGIVLQIQEIMAKPTTSDRYKAALQKKLQYYADTYQADPHSPEIVAREAAKARTYLEKVSKVRTSYNETATTATWIFGDGVGPTALDAHTVVFLGRLIDAGRANLIGRDMLEYAEQNLQKTDWTGIVKGRSTLHSLWERREEARGVTK